jgi:hypothetical protein
MSSPAPAMGKPPSETPVVDPGEFRLGADQALVKWTRDRDPAALRQAGLSILEYHRWWLWTALGQIDPIARNEDNIRTQAVRLRNRLALHDSVAADRLYALSDEVYWLRNRLDHGAPTAPTEGRIRAIIDNADDFTQLVQKAIARLALPTETPGQVQYIREQLDGIDGQLSLIDGHYPDQAVEKFRTEAKTLRDVLKIQLPNSAVEPVMILLREYQNSLDLLSSEMYSTCPRCGGPMKENTTYSGSGGTEDDPEPTSVTGFWSIACERCGHAVESESFGV